MKKSIIIAALIALPAFSQCPMECMPDMKGIQAIGSQLVLEQYDTDKDGKLSPEERKAMSEATMKTIQEKKDALVKKYDKDGDGKLSKEEWQAVKEDWLKENPALAQKMEEKKAAFDKMKAEKEAKKAECRSKCADEMIAKHDKDGDGKLSKDELVAAMAEMKPLKHGCPPYPGMRPDRPMKDGNPRARYMHPGPQMPTPCEPCGAAGFGAPGCPPPADQPDSPTGPLAPPANPPAADTPAPAPPTAEADKPARPIDQGLCGGFGAGAHHTPIPATHQAPANKPVTANEANAPEASAAEEPREPHRHHMGHSPKMPRMHHEMLAAGLAIMEKYDEDKNGILSEAELNKLREDAAKAAQEAEQQHAQP